LFYEHCDSDKCHGFNPIDKSEVPKQAVGLQKRKLAAGGKCNELSPLDITLSKLKDNNLGGEGPKSGPQKIRYSKVGINKDGKFFDLVIEVLVEGIGQVYSTSNPMKNGLKGSLGAINVEAKVTAKSKIVTNKFKFSFVETDTDTPVVLDKFVFKFFDLDRDEKLTLHESICLDLDQVAVAGDTDIPNLKYNEATKLFTNIGDNSAVSTKYQPGTACSGGFKVGGSVKVTGERVGFSCDNPDSYLMKTISCAECGFNSKQCTRRGKYFPIDQAKKNDAR
jgi:hypothetical protein